MDLPAKIAIFVVTTLAWALPARSADYIVRGIVRDSVTDSPLGRASVMVDGARRSVVADESGLFELAVPADARALKVSCMGYASKTVRLRRNPYNMYAVYLSPAAVGLREVVVRRRKYSKRGNPAVDFARRIKEAGPAGDPAAMPYYTYDKYTRTTVAANDFRASGGSALARATDDITLHVDTSDVTGKPILSLVSKERASRVYRRRDPSAVKERVAGVRSTGIDHMLDPEAMRVFLDDAMREIDLYDADLTILGSRFVSPLSPLAPDFYRFYLTDTVSLPGLAGRYAVLSFYPRNKASYGFTGHLYVDVADSTMAVRRVDLRLPSETPVNFVDALYITQTYDISPEGRRLKTLDDLTMELSALGGGKGGNLYARRTTSYTGHTFAPQPDSVYASEGPELELPGAAARDDDFWLEARTAAMPRGESRLDRLLSDLRRRPVVYWGERVLRTIFTGYFSPCKDSPVDIGPVNTLVSFNSIEGTRLRLGGMTTARLSPRWFGRAYGAWGTRDHRWKHLAEVEYSFIDKTLHSREFPMRSLRFTSQYDIDRPGLHYMATSPDNVVLSLRRISDDRAAYRRLQRLDFLWEMRSGLSFDVAVGTDRMEGAPTMPFILGDGTALGHYTQNFAELTLRYAPGEKFVQGRLHRVPVNYDAPALTLRHTCSPGGLWGSRYTVNRTELDIRSRVWLSAWGYLDLSAAGTHVWGRAPFPALAIPNANISYTIQPRAMALLNPMEFICTSAASWEVEYNARGALLNLIPLVKRARLREVVGFRGFWGRLDRHSDPALDPALPRFPEGTARLTPDHTPYMEISAGLDNILRLVRLEYYWRLTYRHVPYSIDRSGLRIALHATF